MVQEDPTKQQDLTGSQKQRLQPQSNQPPQTRPVQRPLMNGQQNLASGSKAVNGHVNNVNNAVPLGHLPYDEHKTHLSGGSERLEDSPGYMTYSKSANRPITTQQGKKHQSTSVNQPIRSQQSASYVSQPNRNQQSSYQQPIRPQSWGSRVSSRIPASSSNRWETNSYGNRKKNLPPYLDPIERKGSYRTGRRITRDTLGATSKLCSVKRPTERTTGMFIKTVWILKD